MFVLLGLDKEQIIKGQWGTNIIVKLIFKYFLSIKASDPTLTFINLNSLVSTLATDLIMLSFQKHGNSSISKLWPEIHLATENKEIITVPTIFFVNFKCQSHDTNGLISTLYICNTQGYKSIFNFVTHAA